MDPGRRYGSLVIKASGVTIDGRGAWLIVAADGDPAGFQGTAILAEGVSHVTLKNINARGWERGLVVRGGARWSIGDIGLRGEEWRAYHWSIEQNRLENNRWGIYLQHADWIDAAANRFQDNSLADAHDAGNVTRSTRRAIEPGDVQPPIAQLSGPSTARVDEPVCWDASATHDPARRKLSFRWDMRDGTQYRGPVVKHVYRQAGFYRLGLIVDNEMLSDLAYRDVYVNDDAAELGTE